MPQCCCSCVTSRLIKLPNWPNCRSSIPVNDAECVRGSTQISYGKRLAKGQNATKVFAAGDQSLLAGNFFADHAAKYAMSRLPIMSIRTLQLLEHMRRHDRQSNDLAMNVRQGGSRGVIGVLEWHAEDHLIILAGRAHAVSVRAKDQRGLLIRKFLHTRQMPGRFDDDLMAADCRERLEESGRRGGMRIVRGQRRVQVRDDSDLPILAVWQAVGGNGGRRA